MSILKFTQKPIKGNYVIAADSLDDTAPYTGDGDSFVYFNPFGGWDNLSKAEVYYSEMLLAQALEKATDAKITKELKYTPFPVYVESVITTVNTDSFKEHTMQLKRARALAKLTDEDMVALGLQGDE